MNVLWFLGMFSEVLNTVIGKLESDLEDWGFDTDTLADWAKDEVITNMSWDNPTNYIIGAWYRNAVIMIQEDYPDARIIYSLEGYYSTFDWVNREECITANDDYSSTHGDYSPNNPWDAPGMSVRDFII